ncbi:hypothetical protein Bpro_4267 [Polaromonas sp. JS666]|nr:hypothetical protein Bpro_4267 [Polaromonas sp. JS666]
MALNFSNPSRSYDASRHCVCLWGCARETDLLADDAMPSRPPVAGSDESAVLAVFTSFTYPCRRQAPLRRSARRTPEEHHARH